MKITVTGGSGFLGNELVKKLIKLGHEVSILDIIEPEENLGVNFYNGDITNYSDVENSVGDSKIIYHLAAIVPISKKSKKDFLKINATGTKNILDVAKKNNARVVFCSTSSPLYDDIHKMPITENTTQNPSYYYGESKFEAEKICNEYRNQGLNICIIRPRMIIGPGRLGLIEILSEWIRTNKPIPIFGTGLNKLQFLDVDDLVMCLTTLININNDVFNQDYNIGSGKFDTLTSDINAVIKHTGSLSKFVHLPLFYKPIMYLLNIIGLTPFTFFHLKTISNSFYFDTSKAEKNLGWKSVYSNQDSLIRSYDWYIKNKDKIKTGEGHTKKIKKNGILKLVPFLLEMYLFTFNLIKKIAVVIATGFGISYINKIARGTVGAMLALLFIPWYLQESLLFQLLLIISIILIAIFCSSVAENKFNKKDDSKIVVDEFVSIFITFFAIPTPKITLPIIILGFLLNRIFDILKPYPAKKIENISGGIGIVFDDVISSIYSWLFLIFLISFL